VSDRCDRVYDVNECECNRNGIEPTCDEIGEKDPCKAVCCDPSLNYRLRARNVVKQLMTNEYINRCWCEWANTETCRYEDGSRCHRVCCDHLKTSIERDESRMKDLLDYLDSRRGDEGENDDSNNAVVEEMEYEPEPHCDCGWANRRSCHHDDGTVCHYVCCPRRKSNTRRVKRKRHKIAKPKRHLTLVEELRAMLTKRQRHEGGVLLPI